MTGCRKRAGYFSRVVHCLVMRKWPRGENNEQSAQIIQFLQAHPEVLDKMINHVETTSVAEVGGPVLAAAAKSTSS